METLVWIENWREKVMARKTKLMIWRNKMLEQISAKHWRVIGLRKSYFKGGKK